MVRKEGLIFIALDFDGTVVDHAYPEIGKPVPGAVDSLLFVQKHFRDVEIIVNTMRSGKYLNDAVDFLVGNGIKVFGANVNPTQGSWTDSPKVYAQISIDDTALGCPLIQYAHFGRRCVRWGTDPGESPGMLKLLLTRLEELGAVRREVRSVSR